MYRMVQSKPKKLFRVSLYQIKRYIIFNIITWPVSTSIWLPYNYYVLKFTEMQVKVWFITGAIMGAIVSVIMTYVSGFAVHYADKHLKNPELLNALKREGGSDRRSIGHFSISEKEEHNK